jgi:hypothetical protein
MFYPLYFKTPSRRLIERGNEYLGIARPPVDEEIVSFEYRAQDTT